MKINNFTKIILTVNMLCLGNAFALSLGDNVTSNTMKAQTTTTSTMVLTSQQANHNEYTITQATGTTKVLTNKQGKIYGFAWNDKNPDFKSMLGSYKATYDAAYAKRAYKYDHRRLMINTPTLSVEQFGLPGGPMQGSMVANDLAPK